MSIIDAQDATTAELSEELIFLIAAVSTDAQRKHAIELFRRFARQIEAEAFYRGQQSVARTLSKPVTTLLLPAPTSTEADQPRERVNLIPPVKWQD